MKLLRSRIQAEISSHSMADIAFLLVVYFMLTVTFSVTKGLDFRFSNEPDDAIEIDPIESVHVKVLATGGLLVDRRPMELGGLLPYLAPKLATNPRKPVIVESEPDAPYGHMVAVLDELRLGKERLALEHDVNVVLPTERERASWVR